jgi:hypothetical protein
MQENLFPKNNLDVMRPAPEVSKKPVSEYADPSGAKHIAAPQLFDIKGKPIYDAEGNLDWWSTHARTEGK